MLKIFKNFLKNRLNNYNGFRSTINIKEITYKELLQKVKDGAILIDVRTNQEFNEGHISRAIVIPYYEISDKIQSLVIDKKDTIIIYCQNGGRGKKACEILEKLGYENVYNLKDGIEGIC